MPQTGRTTARHDPAVEAACGVGSYEWWPAEDRLVWSPGLIRMYGLTRAPTAEEGFSRLVHPEDRVRVGAETSAYLGADTTSYSRSFRIVRLDGSVRFILDRGVIERDENGIVRVMRGLNVDLTDDPYLDRRTMAGNRSGVRRVEEVNEIEEKLRESAATLLHAQRCANAGIWDVDLVNNHVTWSEPYYDLFGLPRSVQPSYENWIASIHPDDRERVDAEAAQALAARGLHRIEFRILRDGQVRWLDSEGCVICDSANHPVRVTGITWDVTARKQAEAALRKSEEGFRLFMSHSPTPAWVKDEHGRHVYLSKTYAQRFGLRHQDWHGKTDAELWPAATAGAFRESDLAVLAGGQAIEFVEEIVNPEGSHTSWLTCKFPFRDAAGNRFVAGIALDITERKKAEAALQQSEARLQAVLDGSPDPIFVKDREGRQVLANPATYAAIGKPAEACLGKTDEQFLDNPADGRTIMATDRRIMVSGQAEPGEAPRRTF